MNKYKGWINDAYMFIFKRLSIGIEVEASPFTMIVVTRLRVRQELQSLSLRVESTLFPS